MDPAAHRLGSALCIASAIAFGAMAIFGKLAYDAGVGLLTLLFVRFSIAAPVLWIAALRRPAALSGTSRRTMLGAFALGAVGYSMQAALYFAALTRMDASLLSMLLYTFPAMVAVAAIVLGREHADPARLGALLLASIGLVLVLASAKPGALDPLGAALALGAALIYTTYILVSQGIAGRLSPTVLSALVCTGAAVSLAAGSAALGELRPGEVTPAGWGWLAGIALVSTVAAVSLFFAGLKRVGPTTASILSTVEPVVTVVLAFAVFGELLGALQMLGGALVVGAVLVLASYRPREAMGVAAA